MNGGDMIRYDNRDVTFVDLDPKDYIEQLLSKGQWYELSNLEFVRDLQEVGNYVDVGSYIGTHALYFSLFCPSYIVHAFEPRTTFYNKLIKNLEANDVTNCVAHQLALSDRPGFCRITAPEGNQGNATLRESRVSSTAMVTLDSLALDNIRVMKIDVEGHELPVLKGATETLKSVKHLFLEIWSEGQCGVYKTPYLLPTIQKFLSEQGFDLQPRELSESLRYFKRR
jgi:FkbM family methyltransferase